MKKLVLLLAFVFLGSSWASAQAQTVGPPNNMGELASYSLFLSKYRNQNYQGALKFGRWILLSMPQKIEGYSAFDLSTNLSRFITIYTTFADRAEKPSVKAAYIDTVQTIFTKTFNRFSKDEIDLYSWRIQQGRFLQDYADIIGENAQEKALEAYRKAFTLNPETMATTSNGYYLKVLLRDLAEKNTDQAQQKAIAIITKAEPYANEDLQGYFDDIRQKLFDEPAERIAYLEKQLEENSENVQVLRSLRNAYMRQGKAQRVQELNQRLYELKPSYQNIVSLANYAMGHANYQQAVEYWKEALNKTDESAKLKTIYYKLAKAQMNLGNFSQAANYAHQAINVAPGWGRPYLQLATIYARTVRNCAAGRDLTKNDRAVYWLVIDYIQKAKSVDPSVANRAGTLLQTYRPVTPSQQDIFFSDSWEKGATVSVSSLGQCYAWINETTTVR